MEGSFSSWSAASALSFVLLLLLLLGHVDWVVLRIHWDNIAPVTLLLEGVVSYLHLFQCELPNVVHIIIVFALALNFGWLNLLQLGKLLVDLLVEGSQDVFLGTLGNFTGINQLPQAVRKGDAEGCTAVHVACCFFFHCKQSIIIKIVIYTRPIPLNSRNFTPFYSINTQITHYFLIIAFRSRGLLINWLTLGRPNIDFDFTSLFYHLY